MEIRTVIKETPTGLIELIWNGAVSRIEFNTACLDSLGLCRAMCCRVRATFSIELEEDELERFQHRQHPARPGIWLLASKENSTACLYLDEEKSICTVHELKPRMCQRWHCSSGGEKEDRKIERRDGGWMLTPMRREEVELVQIEARKQNGTAIRSNAGT